MIGKIIWALVIGVFALFFYFVYVQQDSLVEVCSKVVDVGGCTRYAECRVRLANGRIQMTEHSVKGETVCYYKRRKEVAQ